MTHDSIEKLKREAFELSEAFHTHPSTFATRMAYVNGIHAMAQLITACANAAEELRDEQTPNSISYIMLSGYAQGLRNIANAADELIPEGYEL